MPKRSRSLGSLSEVIEAADLLTSEIESELSESASDHSFVRGAKKGDKKKLHQARQGLQGVSRMLPRNLPQSSQELEHIAEDSFKNLGDAVKQFQKNPQSAFAEVGLPLMQAAEKFIANTQKCLKEDGKSLSGKIFSLLENLFKLVCDVMGSIFKQKSQHGLDDVHAQPSKSHAAAGYGKSSDDFMDRKHRSEQTHSKGVHHAFSKQGRHSEGYGQQPEAHGRDRKHGRESHGQAVHPDKLQALKDKFSPSKSKR